MEDKIEAPRIPDYIHLSGETAQWVLAELTEWWESTAADSIHYTYHLTKALMELRMGLDMEID